MTVNLSQREYQDASNQSSSATHTPKNHHALMDIFKLFNPQSVDVQDEINPGSLR